MQEIQELERLYPIQLEEFKNNKDLLEDFKNWNVKEGNIIVRFFTVVRERKSGLKTKDNKLGTSKPKITVPTNVAMVVRSGHEKIKEGFLVTLPYTETAGTILNPEMEAYKKALANTKGGSPIVPTDSRERIGALEYNHKRKMVLRPGNILPDEMDQYTYIFNGSEIQLWQENKVE